MKNKIYAITLLLIFGFIKTFAQEKIQPVDISTNNISNRPIGKIEDPKVIIEKLKSLPNANQIPQKLFESLSRVPKDRLIVVTCEEIEQLPLVGGIRKINFENLVTEKASQTDALPTCLTPPFYVQSCHCSGGTLFVENIPVTYCESTCFPLVGIAIMCETPCWSAIVGCF